MMTILHNLFQTYCAAYFTRAMAGVCALVFALTAFLQLQHFTHHDHAVDPVHGTVHHTSAHAQDSDSDADQIYSTHDEQSEAPCSFCSALSEYTALANLSKHRGDPGLLRAKVLFLERSWHPFAPRPPTIPAHLLAPKTSPPTAL